MLTEAILDVGQSLKAFKILASTPGYQRCPVEAEIVEKLKAEATLLTSIAAYLNGNQHIQMEPSTWEMMLPQIRSRLREFQPVVMKAAPHEYPVVEHWYYPGSREHDAFLVLF